MRYENIGWIGLGKMGGAMAENLYKEGYLKYAFNRTPTVTEKFIRDKKDVKIAESLKELGSNCDLVFVSVKSYPSSTTTDMILDMEGLTKYMKPGSVIVETGNSDYRETQKMGIKLKHDKQIDLIDCPVSGGPRRAREGDLVAIVGGDKEIFDDIRPVINSFAPDNATFYMGELGKGHEAKMYHNQDEQDDMRNIAEILSVMITGYNYGYHDAVDKLNIGENRSKLIGYAKSVSEEEFKNMSSKVNGGDLPTISIETGLAEHHPTPTTFLTVYLRRLSRAEINLDQVINGMRIQLSKNELQPEYKNIIKMYNYIREKIKLEKNSGPGLEDGLSEALGIGYCLDLAVVLSLAMKRGLDMKKLINIFSTGLCDKASVKALDNLEIVDEVHEQESGISDEDKLILDNAFQTSLKVNHPVPSISLYRELVNHKYQETSFHELSKLGMKEMYNNYSDTFRIQAITRYGFGEHTYDVNQGK